MGKDAKKPTAEQQLATASNKLASQTKLTTAEKKKAARLSKDLDRAKKMIAKLNSDLAAMRDKCDEKLRKFKGKPAERYRVVSKRPIRIAGEDAEAGSTVGYITAVEGAEPQLVTDALRYNAARIEPTKEAYEPDDVVSEIGEEEMQKLVDDATAKLEAKYAERIVTLEDELAKAKAAAGDATPPSGDK